MGWSGIKEKKRSVDKEERFVLNKGEERRYVDGKQEVKKREMQKGRKGVI